MQNIFEIKSQIRVHLKEKKKVFLEYNHSNEIANNRYAIRIKLSAMFSDLDPL